MQETARRIFAEQSLMAVEGTIAPIAEVFRLQNEHELAWAEKRYLPTGEHQVIDSLAA